MKKLLAAIILMTSLMAWADAFEDGVAAYYKKDYKTALEKFTPFANKGYASAQFNLGVMYDDGKGVVQDYKQAVRWYTLAAEQGNAGAQFNLSLMYSNGLGVVQDYKQAVRWYTLAAEQGEPSAQLNLGVKYLNGQGVLQNYVKAHMWINIATANGETKGPKNRDIVAAKMNSQQIERAQQMARDCMAKNYKRCN